MQAGHSTYGVEPADAEQGSQLVGAMITIIWALVATLSLFAFLGGIALFVI